NLLVTTPSFFATSVLLVLCSSLFSSVYLLFFLFFFFFNDTAPTEIYTLSLHDALPISIWRRNSASMSRSMRERRSAARNHDRNLLHDLMLAPLYRAKDSQFVPGRLGNHSYENSCLSR